MLHNESDLNFVGNVTAFVFNLPLDLQLAASLFQTKKFNFRHEVRIPPSKHVEFKKKMEYTTNSKPDHCDSAHEQQKADALCLKKKSNNDFQTGTPKKCFESNTIESNSDIPSRT